MEAKWVIFDVGDTLVHYVPNYADIYGTALAALGLRPEPALFSEIMRRVYAAGFSLPAGEIRQRRSRAILSCFDLDAAAYSRALQVLNDASWTRQEAVLDKDALPVLRALRARGFRLAVVSNYVAALKELLQHMGIYELFDAVVISAVVGVAKPDPRIMAIALEELGADASQCVYVCDQPEDIACAHAAGIRAILVENPIVPYGDVGEDLRVHCIAELDGALEYRK